MLRPKHHSPRPSTSESLVAGARGITARTFNRWGGGEPGTTVTFVSVLYASEREALVRTEPCTSRRGIVTQQGNLVICEYTLRRVDGAPPRVAQSGREGLRRKRTFIELNAPGAPAGIAGIPCTAGAAVRRVDVGRCVNVSCATMTFVAILYAGEAIRLGCTADDTAGRGVIGEHCGNGIG